MTRLAYTALFFVNALLATAMRAFGDGWLKHLWSFDGCDTASDVHCVGNQAVYRASFAICCFFLLMVVLSALSERGHANCCCLWCFQLPAYVTLLVLSFFIPSAFFDGYAWLARVASVVFLVLQIIIIIDFMYNVRDYLLDRIEAAEADAETTASLLGSSTPANKSWVWKSVYLTIVLVCLGGAFTGIALLYKYYGGCSIGMAFTTTTLVTILIATGISITEWAGTGIMPPSIVAAYAVLLCYQALAANPDATCNPLLTYEAASHANTILSSLLGAATITWTSWSTSSSASSALQINRSTETEEKDGDKAAADTPSWQFHLIMVFGGLYMAMVLTQWGSLHGLADDVNMWVQIASQWIVLLLYVWTLVAPRVCTSRDFDV
ncbi:serine incorporator-like [Achlya hypogyna]|uniref:Serine incorporator-like n=1 Tax=Achlya hypogyna TaxID=1202772 RepID=A0A1V9Z1N2_ACHHY|nr:serine incorporator-like [Achlya hypogyna]